MDDAERMEQVDNLIDQIDDLKALLREIRQFLVYFNRGDSLVGRIDAALEGG